MEHLDCLLRKRSVVRVRGCRLDHKKSIPFNWANQSTRKILEVVVAEGLGLVYEGVALSEVVLQRWRIRLHSSNKKGGVVEEKHVEWRR